MLIGFTLYCNSYVKVNRKLSDNNSNNDNNIDFIIVFLNALDCKALIDLLFIINEKTKNIPEHWFSLK